MSESGHTSDSSTISSTSSRRSSEVKQRIPKVFKEVFMTRTVKKNLIISYADHRFLIGFKQILIREFLTLPGLLPSDAVSFEYCTFNGEETIYISRVRIRGTMSNEGVGVHKVFARSYDMASYNLIQDILKTNIDLVMPRRVVPLPKWRGHCFLNVALIPLFHCPIFVHKLCSKFFEISAMVNNGSRKKATASDFVGESPDLWVTCLYEGFRVIRKASLNPLFDIINVPPGLEYKMECYAKMGRRPKIAPTIDLDLDDFQTMLLGFLSKFVSTQYQTSGGDESEAYHDLVQKLIRDCETFHGYFMNVVTCKFHCQFCRKQTLDLQFNVPVINLPPLSCNFRRSPKISDYILTPHLWRRAISVRCPMLVHGSVCGGEYRELSDVKLKSLATIIAVHLNHPDLNKSHNSVLMEEELNFIFNGENYAYERIGYSCVFRTYKEGDKSCGDRFIWPEEHYKESGWHTVLYLKTNVGYVEVNNGRICEPEPYLLDRYTNTCLVLYRKKQTNWLPVLE